MEYQTGNREAPHLSTFESTLRELQVEVSDEEKTILLAASHVATVNSRLETGRMSATRRSSRKRIKQAHRAAYRSTIGDLQRLGAVSVFWWIARPIFMWVLRRFIQRVIDRWFDMHQASVSDIVVTYTSSD